MPRGRIRSTAPGGDGCSLWGVAPDVAASRPPALRVRAGLLAEDGEERAPGPPKGTPAPSCAASPAFLRASGCCRFDRVPMPDPIVLPRRIDRHGEPA